MKITGNAAYFLESNTDTDVIIPARFLKRTSLDGFEPFAFFEKRYTQETECEPTLEKRDYVFQKTVYNQDCPLNHPNAKGASFLVTWENFGCGSSREHAVYALRNYKVIIGSAPEGKSAFADIFRDNCRQNLIWTPVISASDHQALVAHVQSKLESEAVELTLDVEGSVINTADGYLSLPFTMPKTAKDYILAGQDPFEKANVEIKGELSAINTWYDGHKDLLDASPNASL